MNTEKEAYDTLIAGGGRPSHPFHLLHDVLAAPGKYRDILTFWQDRPDEWQVFTKQLQRWRRFRQFQASERTGSGGSFPLYTHRVETYLAHQHDFTFPPAFRTAAGGLQEDPGRQGKLATWIEYLFFEHMRSDAYKKSIADRTPEYLEAWGALVGSGVLDPAEQAGDLALELCRTSSVQGARRMYERRKIGDDMAQLRSWPASIEARLLPEERRDQEQAERKYLHLQKKLESRDTRAKEVLKFKEKTEPYWLAKYRYDRHRALLQWALDQVPLIVEEEERLGLDQPSILPSIEAEKTKASDGADSSAAPRTFPQFQRLPAELRHRVWTECLPPRPTAHFFDVLNHPRKRHMAQYWSTKEFRVAATKDRDSGYRVIYHLLATCRESRIVVADFYRRVQHDRSSGSQWQYPFPIFQTFNWIPADDLIILSLPPKQAALPEHHAITFNSSNSPARNVAIYMPMELLMISQFGVEEEGTGRLLRDGMNSQGVVDEESQVSLIPEFLDTLRRGGQGENDGTHPRPGGSRGAGGIKKVYILYEGWSCSPYGSFGSEGPATTRMPTEEDRAWLAKGRRTRRGGVSWHFRGARNCETVAPWYKVTSDDPDKARTRRRLDFVEWWWLGSGESALRGRDAKDLVE